MREEKITSKDIIDYLVAKRVDNGLEVFAIVYAKNWYSQLYAEKKIPIYFFRENDYVVCKWIDYNINSGATDIQGKQTIAICRNRKDADLIYESITNNCHENRSPSNDELVNNICSVCKDDYFKKNDSEGNLIFALRSFIRAYHLTSKWNEWWKNWENNNRKEI